MKFLVLITIQLIGAIANGQTTFEAINTKARLATELKEAKEFEWPNPYCDSCTKIRNKADSLFKNSTLEECLFYFVGTRYVLKTYSFLKILELNDSIAFKKFSESIKDTTPVFLLTYDAGGTIPFNRLIGAYYKEFICAKYLLGGKQNCYDRTYIFSTPIPSIGKEKIKSLKYLIKKSNLKYEDLAF